LRATGDEHLFGINPIFFLVYCIYTAQLNPTLTSAQMGNGAIKGDEFLACFNEKLDGRPEE
jgi:hypothetical protein